MMPLVISNSPEETLRLGEEWGRAQANRIAAQKPGQLDGRRANVAVYSRFVLLLSSFLCSLWTSVKTLLEKSTRFDGSPSSVSALVVRPANVLPLIAISLVPASTIPDALRSVAARLSFASPMWLLEKLLPVTVIRLLAGPMRRASFLTIVNVFALTAQP